MIMLAQGSDWMRSESGTRVRAVFRSSVWEMSSRAAGAQELAGKRQIVEVIWKWSGTDRDI